MCIIGQDFLSNFGTIEFNMVENRVKLGKNGLYVFLQEQRNQSECKKFVGNLTKLNENASRIDSNGGKTPTSSQLNIVHGDNISDNERG